MVLSTGLSNTSFVGLPMTETFYGPQELATGIISDQLQTYLVLSTLGIAVARYCSNASASARTIALRIVMFPPLVALVAALALSSVEYPAGRVALRSRT